MIALPSTSLDALPSLDQAAQPCDAASEVSASFAGLLMVMQQQPQVPAPALPTDLPAPDPLVGGMLKTSVAATPQSIAMVASPPSDAPEPEALPTSTQSILLQDAPAGTSSATIPSADTMPPASGPSDVHPTEPATRPTPAAPVRQMSVDALRTSLKRPSKSVAAPAAAPVVARHTPSLKVEADVVTGLGVASLRVMKVTATTIPPPAVEASVIAPEAPDPTQPAIVTEGDAAGAPAAAPAAARSPQSPPDRLEASATRPVAAVPITTMPVDVTPGPVAPVAPVSVATVPQNAHLPAVIASAAAVIAAPVAVGLTPVPAAKTRGDSSDHYDQPAATPGSEPALLSAPAPQVLASPSAVPATASAPAPTHVASASGTRPTAAAPPGTEPPVVTHLRLELAPPLLGEVVLELRHERDEIAATATVDRPASLEALKLVQVQVQQVLADQGVHVGSFEVSCRDGRQGREHPAPAEQWVPDRSEPQASPQPRKAIAARASTTLVDLYA